MRMIDCHDAEYHFTREAQELRHAWRAVSDEARRCHLDLANHHRATGLSRLLARRSVAVADPA